MTELVRLTCDADGEMSAAASRAGRGAWLCAESPVACAELAAKKRRFGPAFRRPVSTGAVENLLTALRAAERTHSSR